ncbi:MAG: urease accessory protein UreD [Bauldia sp.]|nr:urease accessory protein UreD [Bauldia sp.]
MRTASSSAEDGGGAALRPTRRGRVDLAFADVGGRTVLARQFAAYPFHLTRPFHFGDSGRGMATLYLQSASGGLYRGDDLAMTIDVEPGAAAEITTQSSTVVHDAYGDIARLRQEATVGADGFLALWPDPVILLPGAMLRQSIEVTLAAGASALVAESWLGHDPLGQGRPFGILESSTVVRTASSRAPLVAERQLIRGADWRLALGGEAGWTAAGNVFVLGALGQSLAADAVVAALALPDVAAGASALPNGAGLGIRLLARDGVALTAALKAAWRVVFVAAFGSEPLPRRK